MKATSASASMRSLCNGWIEHNETTTLCSFLFVDKDLHYVMVFAFEALLLGTCLGTVLFVVFRLCAFSEWGTSLIGFVGGR